MLLAVIANVGRPLDRNAAGFRRSAGDRVPTLVFKLEVNCLDLIEARILQSRETGSHEVVSQIREQHPERREYPRCGGNYDGPDADLARDLNRVQRPRAAIRHQGKVAGVEAALG